MYFKYADIKRLHFLVISLSTTGRVASVSVLILNEKNAASNKFASSRVMSQFEEQSVVRSVLLRYPH